MKARADAVSRARGRRDVRGPHRSSAAGEDDIDRQLRELSSTSVVDDELAKMKAELGSGAAPAAASSGAARRDAGDGRRRGDRGGPGMIVRISGEGQWRLADDVRAAASTSSTTRRSRPSRPATRPRFHALVRRRCSTMVRADGERLAGDDLHPSDVILPPADTSFDEAARRVHRRRPDPGLTAPRRLRPACRGAGSRPPSAEGTNTSPAGAPTAKTTVPASSATASRCSAGSSQEHDAALGDVEALAVDREAGRAVEHEVDLLVAGPLVTRGRELVVRLDDEVAGGFGGRRRSSRTR